MDFIRLIVRLLNREGLVKIGGRVMKPPSWTQVLLAIVTLVRDAAHEGWGMILRACLGIIVISACVDLALWLLWH